MTAAFRKGVEPYADLFQPVNRRLLLRAVLATDGSSVIAGPNQDARKAVCHEIMSSAHDCEQVWAEGEYVVHISAAGDALDYDDIASRYVLVHEDDIVGVLDPAEVEERYRKGLLEEENTRRKANGLPPLTELPIE